MGKGSNAKTQTQTSTTTPNSQAMAAYQQLIGQAQNVASTPWNPETAQQVAGFTDDQNNAFGQIRSGLAQPLLDQAQNFATAGASPITSQSISNYTNPYQQSVIDATMSQMNTENQRQLSQVSGNARMAGSLGGDREQVAKALTAEGQNRTMASTLAGLNQQNYNQALGAAQSDATRALQGAGTFGNLSQLAYTDTNALMNSGNQQQGQQQKVYDAASANASAESAYPFQTTQWLSSILGGIGPQLGSTTTGSGTTTGSTPNTWSQLAGAGIAALPYLSSGGRVRYASGGGISDAIKGLAGSGMFGMLPAAYAGGVDEENLLMPLAGMMKPKASGGGISDTLQGLAGSGLFGIVPMAYSDGIDEENLLAPMMGLMKPRAGGGGISYVPQVQMPQHGAGIQPHQQMRMDGGTGQQKGFADHFKEVTDTAKQASEAFKGVDKAATKAGEWMRTEQAPNGWGTLTVDKGNAIDNAAYGLQNVWGGFTRGLGFNDGGRVLYRTDSGAVDDNTYRLPDGTDWPNGNDPGGSYAMPPESPLAPMMEMAVRPTSGVVGAGQPYAPPPDMAAPGISGSIGGEPLYGINPDGGVKKAVAPPAATPSGFWDWLPNTLKAAGNWVQSDEGKKFTGNAGAAMMANSGVGGKGTFGVHLGQGLQSGFQAQDKHQSDMREAAINTAKMDLAKRAAAIRDSEEGRSATMHPYETALKAAQAKAMLAQANAKEDPALQYKIREQQAKSTGLDPNSQSYRAFVLTGKLPEDGGKFAEAAATAMAKRFDENVQFAATQQEAVSQVEQLRNLSENIGAPGLGNTIARTVGPYARSIGVEIGNLSDMEAFNALISKMVPLLRVPGSGTMSDKDVELFRSSLPQMSSTLQGRNLILDQMQAMTQYATERGKISSQALAGEITPKEAEIKLRNMPDPMRMFRERLGIAPAATDAGGSGGAEGETKVLNGKTYVRRGGKWYEQ